MITFKHVAAAAVSVLLTAGVAAAGSIKVTEFDINDFNLAVSNNPFVVEDFEDITDTPGILNGPLNTDVGTFTSIGGAGSGSTCTQSGGSPDCEFLSLFDTNPNGQGNLVPDDGIWSLNSNDTFGVVWDVVAPFGDFNRVVFGMMDAADQGATVTVTSTDIADTAVFQSQTSGNAKLIVIDFAAKVGSATITIDNGGKLNDAFSVDGASVGVVPLPAAGWMLLAGIGGLAAMRRRRKA
ncbi:MAG: VPLPA-CTERM sorting domain-containing protein [Halieaceae bacterium]|jgi:hypothetical protein|nr:VPLPA-CTERM sorting domain-containing protein [Halieaceae bacterium]